MQRDEDEDVHVCPRVHILKNEACVCVCVCVCARTGLTLTQLAVAVAKLN